LDQPNEPDFNVYEVDFGVPEFGAMDVLVSANGVSFFSVKSSEGPVKKVSGDDAHGNPDFARSYDLSGTGLDRVRFIRIIGAGDEPAGGTNGFDLDAIGALKTVLVECHSPHGDLTRDGLVTLLDHEALVACLAGPDASSTPLRTGHRGGTETTTFTDRYSTGDRFATVLRSSGDGGLGAVAAIRRARRQNAITSAIR
jgi:hypothetical protein